MAMAEALAWLLPPCWLPLIDVEKLPGKQRKLALSGSETRPQFVGSTDRPPQICSSYEKDAPIRVFCPGALPQDAAMLPALLSSS